MGRSRLVLMSLAAFFFALPAAAQTSKGFPVRPLELVVHTAPGGGTDLVARMVADILVKDIGLAPKP